MFKNSLSLGKIGGIPIFVHWSFSLLIAYVVYVGIRDHFAPIQILWSVGLLLAIFFCVLLHELGHSFAAKRYNIDTEDITLLPIGGLARLKEMPTKPMQELIIAIMGPAVNVVIALVFGLIFYFGYNGVIEGQQELMLEPPFSLKKFILLLTTTNIILVVFNMVPAFPMDGGRVLRALLAFKLDYAKATKIASLIGRAAAIGFIAIGFYNEDIVFMLLGGFVFFSATTENKMVSRSESLKGYGVADVLRKRYTILRTTNTVKDAFALIHKGLERNFLVMDDNNSLEGIVTVNLLIEMAKKKGFDVSLESIMLKDNIAVKRTDELPDLYHAMNARNQPIVPVFENDLLVGVIDYRTISDIMEMRQQVTW